MTTESKEHRAHNAITCAEPGCPNAGTVLVPVSETVNLEFCPSHAWLRTVR